MPENNIIIQLIESVGTGLAIFFANWGTNFKNERGYKNKVLNTIRIIIRDQLSDLRELQKIHINLPDGFPTDYYGVYSEQIKLVVNSIKSDNLYNNEIGNIKHIKNKRHEYIVDYYSRLRSLLEDLEIFTNQIDNYFKDKKRLPDYTRIHFFRIKLSIIIAFGFRAKENGSKLNKTDKKDLTDAISDALYADRNKIDKGMKSIDKLEKDFREIETFLGKNISGEIVARLDKLVSQCGTN